MADDRFAWIADVLSTPRFEPYLKAAGGDVALALELYWWNVEVSAAFYAPLQVLEVCLRNAMHRQLVVHFRREDWWAAAPLNDQGGRMVSAVLDKLRRRLERPLAADDVVAELSFGFWVSLLSRGPGYDRTLWVPALHKAFPHYRGKRAVLHDKLQSVVLLRNRIMHHEPIHHRDLRADHKKILTLLGRVSAIALRELERIDHVAEVLDHRPDCGSGSDRGRS